MSERTFKWVAGKEYVEERIAIDGPPGKYTIYVTPISKFEVRKVTVNGSLADTTFIVE